ncbi:scopoletin glucosyltransferase-like [Nymphaea colorata]|nr:scopoletin glucosyltransferase-like [Nymphaea colorata]
MEDQFQHRPYVVVFPMMAQGHMNPMIDLAMILASHSCKVTILTTLLNSFRYHSVTEWSRSQGLELRVVHLPFPATQMGLPEDCENLDSTTNPDMLWKFVLGIKILQQPFEEFVRKEPPNCIISDTLFPWTTQTAEKLKIPRYVFHSTNSFFYCVIAGMRSHDSDEEEFAVPGLPHEVRMRRTLLSVPYEDESLLLGMDALHKEMRMSDKTSAGVIFNTSYEIESAYVELFKSMRGCQQLWTVGPLSLISHPKGRSRQEKQGKEQSPIDEDQCLRWLDSKEPRSVMYVCFGSIASLSGAQLMEVGQGLESSQHPFIWVIRGAVEEGFLQELQERVKERGLVIKGWAPQLQILSHQAVGGFMTHCGWNSLLEGISAGLPLLTWPMFGDQHINERLVVDVLGVALSVGNQKLMGLDEEQKTEELVRREQIERAVTAVFGNEHQAREMRRKAAVLSETVRKSVEAGGSSALNLNVLLKNVGCHV